jgi:hypothetical protein
MKINNVTQIKAEDFPEDAQQMAEQLGLVLNPFMQQVVEITDNRLDFENRVENFRNLHYRSFQSNKCSRIPYSTAFYLIYCIRRRNNQS